MINRFKKPDLILVSIIILGIVLQIMALIYVNNPGKLWWADPKLYYKLGCDLANGLSYNNPIVSPGYPYFLAGLIYVFGFNILILQLLHIALFPFFIYNIFKIVEIWKGKHYALFAAFLTIIYPYFLYIPTTLYTESLTILIFPFVLYQALVLRNKFNWYRFILLSAYTTLLIFIRPTNIYLELVVILIIFWKKELFFRNAIIYGSIFSILPVLTVNLWMYRNYKTYGYYSFAAISGSVLYNSYNNDVTPGVKKRVQSTDTVLNNQLRKANNVFEQSKLYNKAANKFIKENKIKSTKIIILNFLNYWNPYPQTNNTDGMASNIKKIVPAISYSFFLVFGFLGIFQLRQEFFTQSILVMLLLNTLLNAVFLVSVRYRVVIDFTLIIFSSYYLLNKISNLKSSKWIQNLQ
jgi:hypothetical protein